MNTQFRYDYGYVYEYGYNIGLFSTLIHLEQQRKLSLQSGIKERMTDWLERPEQNLFGFLNQFRKKHHITDETAFKEIRKNIENIFFFGFISGQHAMKNYFSSLPLIRYFQIEVVYFQFNLVDPLNRGGHLDKVNEFIKDDLMHSFGYLIDDSKLERLKGKGQFLNADSIIFLKNWDRYYLLITDNGLTLEYLEGIDNPKRLLRSLQQVRKKLGEKTRFRNLAMDTSGVKSIPLHKLVLQYTNLVKDKTLNKVVQAGSYAYSFLNFFTQSVGETKEACNVSLMGQADHNYTIINLPLSLKDWNVSDEGRFLEACYHSYKSNIKTENKFVSASVQSLLLKNVANNTNMNREQLKSFVRNVQGIYEISDYLQGFQNTAGKYGAGETFRDDHEAAVIEALKKDQQSIIYLTGNPGIGKTTAIVKELKKQERFLFLYSSCRRTVNDDILLKFTENGRLFADDLIMLSTSYNDETKIGQEYVNVVNYVMNDPRRLKKSTKLTYLNKERDLDYPEGLHSFRTTGDNEFVEEMKVRTGGVLKRLCEGIQEQIENQDIKKIVGTFSIQALKRTKRKDTFQYIQNLFPFVRSSEQMGITVDENEFDRFVEKYPICWIMIDEITGTDEGALLYREWKKLLFTEIYNRLDEERKAKWNLKLIVADASITNDIIVDQCLENESRFDRPKIYITNSDEKCDPLEVKSLPNKKKIKTWFVNANSYPVEKLDLTYHISVQGISKEEYFYGQDKAKIKKIKNLSEEQDKLIVEKIFDHFEINSDEQVIVYIQDLNRIERIKNMFVERYSLVFNEPAEEMKDYLMITSQLSQKTRMQAIRATDRVKCVFMTSSASRGISFKKATKILAALQPFQIERELMEQIQLYYRMRGIPKWELERKKSIELFVADSYVYDELNEVDKKQRTAIHLLSFLTLVRSSLESRVFGRTKIGNNYFSVVPLGGIGISPVQYSLIQDIADSIKMIRKELTRKEKFQFLQELQAEFLSTFGSIEVQTNEQIYRAGFDEKNLYQQFLKHARNNISQLLSFFPFQDFYFANGLVIFPVKVKISQRVSFLIHQRNKMEKLLKKIRKVIKQDITDDLRKKLKHILDCLNFERANRGWLPNHYVENSQDESRYVAIPLLAFTMVKELKEYEANREEETFLDTITGLAMHLTDVTSITPISSDYKDIPFITFKSDALEEQFQSNFQQNFLIASTETNILNLLLLEEAE